MLEERLLNIKLELRMIRLEIEGQTRIFDKIVVIIGSGEVDLQLEEPCIQPVHLKIAETGDRFVITNVANDPFATLNGLPFGKKNIHFNDEIQIGKKFIRFITEKKVALPKVTVSNSNSAHNDEDEDTEGEQEWKEDDKESNLEETIPLSKNLRLAATCFFALMTLCTVMASGFYFRESGKNSQEEKKVAAGMADIAMALTSAHINHISPIKQNWSDPEFLNTNINRVVSPDLHPQAVLNSQGQFNNYPYILRVYTNGDMSQFLVIAQPAPNLFQWLIHKKAIVIDSKSMEIHKISDLKTLNRLLANPNPLAGGNGEEITRLVKESTLMTLSSLAGKKNRWGFTPPKGLSNLKPGSQNYIYNAPRYFPLGESLLDQAIYLSENSDKKYESILFQQDLEVVSQFPNLVLFSSKGIETAVDALKAINNFSPKSEFMIAYIRFNDDGIVINSHLVDKSKMEEIAELEDNSGSRTIQGKLQKISDHRKLNLERISQKIIVLLEEHNAGYLSDFHQQMEALIKEYEAVDNEEHSKLVLELEEKVAEIEHPEHASTQ
jgi:hypothetical protein